MFQKEVKGLQSRPAQPPMNVQVYGVMVSSAQPQPVERHVEDLTRHFPPCMLALHWKLKRKNRLPHYDRVRARTVTLNTDFHLELNILPGFIHPLPERLGSLVARQHIVLAALLFKGSWCWCD